MHVFFIAVVQLVLHFFLGLLCLMHQIAESARDSSRQRERGAHHPDLARTGHIHAQFKQQYQIKLKLNQTRYFYHTHMGMMRHIKASVRLHKWIRNSTSGYFRGAERARARNTIISTESNRIKALNEVYSSSLHKRKRCNPSFCVSWRSTTKVSCEVTLITTNRERF